MLPVTPQGIVVVTVISARCRNRTCEATLAWSRDTTSPIARLFRSAGHSPFHSSPARGLSAPGAPVVPGKRKLRSQTKSPEVRHRASGLKVLGMTVRSLAGEGETLLLLITLPIAAAQRQRPPGLGGGEGQELSGADDHLCISTA